MTRFLPVRLLAPSRAALRSVLAGVTLAVAAVGITGCGIPPISPVATDIDPIQATPNFWWDKPAQVRIPVSDFDRAFAAAQKSATDRFFVVDRADPRDGVITTRAATASQWFEFWRRDNTTSGDVLRASVYTFRRTVRFDIEKTPDGRFAVQPKVLVERQTVVGRRTTGVVGYRGFTSIDQSSLTAVTDEGRAPATYWYAVGRDYNLELELGRAVVDAMY